MSHPLVNTLVLKVHTMITEQATLQLEISQLTNEIKRLKEQQLIWQQQLGTVASLVDANASLNS